MNDSFKSFMPLIDRVKGHLVYCTCAFRVEVKWKKRSQVEVWWKQAGSESGNKVEKGPKVELCWKHGGS